MVVPHANYAFRNLDGILVLQRGENPSTDYYLRPRLERQGVRYLIRDLRSAPEDCALLAGDGPRALMVVFCRYATGAWIQALSERQGRLARVAFFADDDLPAMMRDSSLPAAARGKVALHFGEHVHALSALCSEVWVSTPVLAERYAASRPQVLTPLPETEPAAPIRDASIRVVYHGTDVHGPERRFVADVARLLRQASSPAEIEITGDAALARQCADLDRVTVVPQQDWPRYLASQAGGRAAICLAPLWPSAVNDARAPVKVFDAARLGAVGVYADAPPYRDYVRDGSDGLLLPMRPEAWSAAIQALLADPERRLGLVRAAQERLTALLRSDAGLPGLAAA